MPKSSDVATPSSTDDVAAVLAGACRDKCTTSIRGSGTKAGWTAPGDPVDMVVDTRRLDRIVAHAAGDLVVTAQAGVTLDALQEHVRGAGQWLALDPPEPGATLGGIVATAASGPRRLRYGTPRDLLIGVTIVLADGTVARSGGKVVKNVAGYDLGKLVTGSFGTLAVVAECTFRLHPLPPVRRVVVARVARPGEAAARVLRSGVVPSAMEWDGTSLTVLVESVEAAAAKQAAQVADLLGGEVSDSLPKGFGARPWGGGHEIGLKLTHRIGATADVLRLVADHVPDPSISAHVGSGVVWLGYDGDGSQVPALRDEVASYDGQVVVVEAPEQVKRRVDVWGPARGIEVMRRIKEQFDPDRRLAPGTFVGGI